MKQLLSKITFVLCSLVLHFCGISQVELKQYPQNYHFIARDGDQLIGYDTVKIGVNDISQPLKLRLSVTQNSDPYYSKTLNFQAPVPKEILIPYEVPVSRSYNKVELYLNDNNQPTFSSINVVAGDVIMVSGQSNAEATTVASPQDFDDFLRGFNSYTGNLTPGWQDLARAQSGKWIGRTMNIISRAKNLPLAVLELAEGGKPVKYFLPTDTSMHFKKSIDIIKEARVLNKIRHFLWMQGESDGYGVGIQEYRNDLSTVIRSYLPNLAAKHVYAFQVIPLSCYGVSTNVAEAQRRMHMDDNRITFLAATNSKLGQDSCHFVYEDGYERMGNRMANLLLAEEYNTPLEHYLSPNVDSITTVDFRTITIHMDDNSLELNGAPEADFRISNSTILPTKIELINNKIQLTYPSTIDPTATLSYVAHDHSGLDYIFNKNGVGIFTFAGIKIKKVAPPVLKCNESIQLKSKSSTLLKGSQIELIAIHSNAGPNPSKNSSIEFKNIDTSTLRFVKYESLSSGQISNTNNNLVWNIPNQDTGSTDSVKLIFTVLEDKNSTSIWSQIKATDVLDTNSTPGNGIIGQVNEDDEALIVFQERPCDLVKDISNSNCEDRDSILWKITFSPDPSDNELSLNYTFDTNLVLANYFPDSILIDYTGWIKAGLKNKAQGLEFKRTDDCIRRITITEPLSCISLPTNDLKGKNDFNVFPNVLSNGQVLTVTSNVIIKEYFIYNTLGVQIDHSLVTPSKESKIKLNNYSSGLYFISTNQLEYSPFVIQ